MTPSDFPESNHKFGASASFARHSSAPVGLKCSDCTILELQGAQLACPECQATAAKQIATIPAFVGQVPRGSMEGSTVVVVAWKPNETELHALCAGQPIFLSSIGGLTPHFLTTNFADATNPA